jgi:hypothetical protein
MRAIGQLHDPAALPLGKEPQSLLYLLRVIMIMENLME